MGSRLLGWKLVGLLRLLLLLVFLRPHSGRSRDRLTELIAFSKRASPIMEHSTLGNPPPQFAGRASSLPLLRPSEHQQPPSHQSRLEVVRSLARAGHAYSLPFAGTRLSVFSNGCMSYRCPSPSILPALPGRATTSFVRELLAAVQGLGFHLCRSFCGQSAPPIVIIS